MPADPHFADLARRDWLKTSALGTATTLLAGSGTVLAAEASAAASKPARRVKGVVFMVSDGMSPGVLTLAEAYSRLTRKSGTHWWGLINNRSAARGLMDTASANSMVTDSAAAATAWGGGVRVNNGTINVTPAGKEITPIAAILKQAVKARIGLVTTATVTHATPAGFAAAVASRANEDAIAPQYLDRVDVILGGGSGFFSAGTRADKRDLAGDFAKAGYQVISHRDELLNSHSERLLGTFTRGHLPFTVDRDHDPKLAARVPTLAEMADAALSRFLAADAPFLLQVEGARIDHAAHLNDISGVLGDQLAFDDAIASVLAKTAGRDDILVVVTSDHGNANPGLNGMGGGYSQSTRSFQRIAGIKSSYERIFGEWQKLKNADAARLASLVGSHLGFEPTPAEAEALFEILGRRKVIEWNHQLANPEGLLGQFAGNHTGIGWTGTTHTSDPTLVTAIGPQADRFAGIVTNTDVFTHLVEMLA
jgi:alkaline phosphatase